MGSLLVQPQTTTSTWAIDRVHSTAQSKVKHMMISKVTGEFTSINGILDLDENDITKSKIRASIDAATISTREPQRDAHLKSEDFFHVEKHSVLTFNSTSITRSTDGELRVSGDLTICGVTRNVVFDVGRAPRKRTRGATPGLGFQPPRGSAGKTLVLPGTRPWKLAACWWVKR